MRTHVSISWEEARWMGPAALHMWAGLLFMADGEGVVETSLSTLAKTFRLSIQQVRTCLANMESNKLLTHHSTHLGTKITICRQESCEDAQQSTQQTGQQASNKPVNKPEKEGPLLPPDGSPCTPSLSPLKSPQEKVEEGDADASPKKRAEPVSGPSDFCQSVLEMWNSSARRSIPKVRSLSPARREKVRLRVKEMGGWERAESVLAECFAKIAESDFCNGATGRWTATFDWFFDNEKNWLKVLEGNYDNRRAKTSMEILQENIAKADAYYEQQCQYGGPAAYGVPAGGGQDGPDEQ